MAATVYQSRKTTEEKMNSLFRTMIRDGKTLLPTELKLCELLGASRRVIRELLQEKEERGELIRKPRGRALPLPVTPAGRFTFISGGRNIPENPTWAKLWIMLQQNASAYHLIPEMLFWPWDTPAEAFTEMLKSTSDVLILTNLPAGYRIDRSSTKTLICTDQEIMHENASFIGLDNREAGRLAAQELYYHGYRRPCVMSLDLYGSKEKCYGMYQQRVEGFQECCLERKIPFNPAKDLLFPRFSFSFQEKLAQLTEAVRRMRKGSYDSLFVVCDNDIAMIYDLLLHNGFAIPEQLGLITVNSFDYAIQHRPVINAVSTGTREIANALLSFISDLQTKPVKGSVNLHIIPELIGGTTLTKQKRKRS